MLGAKTIYDNNIIVLRENRIYWGYHFRGTFDAYRAALLLLIVQHINDILYDLVTKDFFLNNQSIL